MTEPPELPVTHAYTRQAVEEYLQSVTAQRAELGAAIAHARARTARASSLTQRIEALEHLVGEWIVGAHAQAGAPHGATAAPAGGPIGNPPPPPAVPSSTMQLPVTDAGRHDPQGPGSWPSTTGWEADHG
jgi:hypothetical protein